MDIGYLNRLVCRKVARSIRKMFVSTVVQFTRSDAVEKDQVAELYYHLPEAAHERLCHTREGVRLLADVTARISGEADHL